MAPTYDKVLADKVFKDLRIGLKTGKFTNWNKGKEMKNDENITVSTETVAKAKGPKGRPASVSSEIFAKLWNEADNLQTVVDKLSRFKAFAGHNQGKIKLYACMRATNLRKTMELKEFKRGRRKKAQVVAE